MFRIASVLIAALIVLPADLRADDKKETASRSLAEEVAYLAEKSGSTGWQSDEIMLTMGGKQFKGRLTLVFTAEKGKATGTIRWGADAAGFKVASPVERFELVEMDGKRTIRIGPEKFARFIQYSLAADELTIKGGAIDSWGGFRPDANAIITLKLKK